MEKPELQLDPVIKAVKARFDEVVDLTNEGTTISTHKRTLVSEAEKELTERLRDSQAAENREQAFRIEEKKLRAWLASNGWVECNAAAS